MELVIRDFTLLIFLCVLFVSFPSLLIGWYWSESKSERTWEGFVITHLVFPSFWVVYVLECLTR